jgi:hypothetical protein
VAEDVQLRPQTGRILPPDKNGFSHTGSIVCGNSSGKYRDDEDIWEESKITAAGAKQNETRRVY